MDQIQSISERAVRSLLIRLRQQRKQWFIAFIGLTICLALVLGTGPQVQAYVFALINEDGNSVYGTFYQNTLVRFRPFYIWLLNSLPFLALSGPIAVTALAQKTPRKIFVATTAVSFALLMLVDIAYGLFAKSLAIGYLLENAVSNFVGAFFLAFFALWLLWGWQFAQEHGPYHRGKWLAGLLLSVLVGLSFSALVFYSVELFYRPIPVRLIVVLDPPIGGVGGYDMPSVRLDGVATYDDSPNFTFMPNSISNGTARWKSGLGKVSAQWYPLSATSKFTATISLYDGCGFEAQSLKLPDGRSPLIVGGLRKLRIWFDDAASELATYDPKGVSGKATLDYDDVRFFNLAKEEGNKGQISITQFVGDDARLRLGDTSGHLSFYLSAFLFSDVADKVLTTPKTLHITTDAENYQLTFTPTASESSRKKSCVPISSKEPFKNQKVQAHDHVTVLVRLDSISGSNVDNFLVWGGNSGWIKIAAEEDDFSHGSGGKLDMFGFNGKASYMEMDGVTLPTTEFDQYQALGSLTANYQEGGRLRVEGTATAFWKNGTRLNPTKWEGLKIEYQGALALSLLFVVGLMGKPILRILADDQLC